MGLQLCASEAEVSSDEIDAPVVVMATKDVVRTAKEAFSRSYAIKLQTELLVKFRDNSFQEELGRLEKWRSVDAERLARERQELMLKVQRVVLPRYGFEGSLQGVQRMMSEWGPFLQDPEFRRLTLELNEVLGIEMPPERWGHVVEHFKRLVATTQPRESPSIRPGLAGRCMAISGGHARSSIAPPCPVVTAGIADHSAPTLPSRLRPTPRAQPWPSEKPRPLRLFVAGSWDNYEPDEMNWKKGLFTYPVMVGQECLEVFQLLVDGDWGKAVYPSIKDATPYEAHDVLGPDNAGHGLNWCIGKLEELRPGMMIILCAQLDVSGRVALVSWQEDTKS